MIGLLVAAGLMASQPSITFTPGRLPDRLPDLAISQPAAFCAGAWFAVQHDGSPLQWSPSREMLTIRAGDDSIDCPAQDAPVVHSPRAYPSAWSLAPLSISPYGALVQPVTEGARQ